MQKKTKEAAIQIRKSKWQGNIKGKRKLNILQQDALRKRPRGFHSQDEHHNYG